MDASSVSRKAIWYEWSAVALVLLFALSFSLNDLTTYPAYWFDEALNIQQARSLAEHGFINLQTAPAVPYEKPYHMTTGYPVVAPLAAIFSAFGFDFGYARVYMIFWILLFLLSAYLLSRDYFGKKAAIFSLLLLATFAPVYGNGETVIAEVPALALLFLGALALTRAKTGVSFFLSGILLGLCASVKPLYFILGPALLGSLYLSRKGFSLRREAPLWIGFLIPVVLYVWTLLPDAGGSGGSMLSFWESRTAQGQFWKNVALNIPRMITESSLLYTLLLSALLAAALPWRRMGQGGEDRSRVTLALYGLLTLLFFLQSIGWNRYLLAYQAIALLFLPFAVEAAYRRWFEGRAFAQRFGFTKHLCTIGLSVLVLIQMVHLFFFATIFHSTGADDFSSFLQKNATAGSVYVVNSAEAAAFVPPDRLHQYFDFFDPEPPMQNRLADFEAARFDHLLVYPDDTRVAPYLRDIERLYEKRGEVRGMALYTLK